MPEGDDLADMDWKDRPGAGRSRRSAWTRRLTVLGGLGAAVTGLVLAIQFMQTPAILLDYSSPPGSGPISEYAATHTASGSLPPGPRTGLWIEVAALHIALPVREGDGSNNIPDWVALHYPGTAQPGQPGNSYLYAHGLIGMFGALLFAHTGELVLLHDYSTGLISPFHISRVVGRVAYNDTSWISTTSNTPLLTLQTCIGPDLNTDRWIVQATP